ncbi:cutinase family protein [Actinokineospora pegani]|uniref:cutinase family protein n=1 Tax=Actinokineospora pegani TaxID=2654637 RepID=UPI0012EAE753|nr:cutinase family protein [Actinokineospora pegani]
MAGMKKPALWGAAAAAAVTAAVAVTPLVGSASAAEGADCSSLQVVIARGTTEFGQYGFIVGDNIVPEVRKTIPDATAKAVEYPASFDANSPRTGYKSIVDHINARSAECPDERYSLVGYSQGAQIVNAALGVDVTGTINGFKPEVQIPAALYPRIASVVLYGNPLKTVDRQIPEPLRPRLQDFCAEGDPVCEKGAINIIAHLTYGLTGDVAKGGQFIAANP